jgi:hypothetical protein
MVETNHRLYFLKSVCNNQNLLLVSLKRFIFGGNDAIHSFPELLGYDNLAMIFLFEQISL